MITLFTLGAVTWLELDGCLLDATPTPPSPLPAYSFHGQPRQGLFGDFTVVRCGTDLHPLWQVRLDDRVLATFSDARSAECFIREMRATLLDDGMVDGDADETP